MQRLKKFLPFILLACLLFCLCACGRGGDCPQADDVYGDVTAGMQTYRGFVLDNVYHSPADGDIHFNLYIPASYDGSQPYALYITLPGYEGLYRFGAGANLRAEEFAFVAQRYNDEMIIVAPQLGDWGTTSANQAVALAEYFIGNYNIDRGRVYANGYSGGGETLSLVMDRRPNLFAAILHVSSVWDGDISNVAGSRTPVYFVIGESDEYYGSSRISDTYRQLVSLYQAQGLSSEEIGELAVLDIKDEAYFQAVGAPNQHGGGGFVAYDSQIMGWLFSREKEMTDTANYTLNTRIDDVISDPAFGDYGRLIFPVDDWYYSGDTLGNLSMTWYSHIDPNKTVEICNYLKSRAAGGERIFYDIYTDEEKAADPSLEDTGLFFFRGNRGAPFAVTCAGGGNNIICKRGGVYKIVIDMSGDDYVVNFYTVS